MRLGAAEERAAEVTKAQRSGGKGRGGGLGSERRGGGNKKPGQGPAR